jgi:NTP pyrophosphatase (non-canonical NTP hydrolase)
MTVWGPNFNGRVFAVPDRSSAEPENQAEALKPFTTFAKECVEKTETGWQWSSGLHRDRISDWFGPSDFGLLAHFAALASLPEAPAVPVWVTIAQLQRAHVERQEEWCPDQKPDLSFRGNEMAGEVGEACNVIKKLERERHGWRGSRATKEQLAEELGDVIHTAILCAITAGIDLEPATVAKFNATSEKNGLSHRIALQSSPPVKAAAVDGEEPYQDIDPGEHQEILDALAAHNSGEE